MFWSGLISFEGAFFLMESCLYEFEKVLRLHITETTDLFEVKLLLSDHFTLRTNLHFQFLQMSLHSHHLFEEVNIDFDLV